MCNIKHHSNKEFDHLAGAKTSSGKKKRHSFVHTARGRWAEGVPRQYEVEVLWSRGVSRKVVMAVQAIIQGGRLIGNANKNRFLTNAEKRRKKAMSKRNAMEDYLLLGRH